MKKHLFLLLSAVTLFITLPHAAETKAKSTYERYFGKISAIDQPGKNLTVQNKSKNENQTFVWDDQTALTDHKKEIKSHQLATGQYLMVSYEMEGTVKKARKIAVRSAPFKKKEAQ